MVEINSEEYTPKEPNKRVKTLNIENRTFTDPIITISILKQENKENVELMKKIMSRQKTKLPS